MTENHENLFDDDGYPTEKSLDRIANWNYNDVNECFNFIERYKTECQIAVNELSHILTILEEGNINDKN